MHWFRFYDGVVDDPKIQKLSPLFFRLWVNLLCLASANKGALPSLPDLSFSLRIPEKQLSEMIGRLTEVGLVDQTESGLEPHNWNGRQFKADVSTERVQRFRERHKKQDETVSRNAPDTEQIQSRTDKKKEATPSAWLFVLPDFIPGRAWDDFLDMRIKSRKPATERAKTLLAKSLERLMIEGHDPTEVLNQSTANSWTDVYPIKEKTNGNGRKPSPHENFALGALLAAKG